MSKFKNSQISHLNTLNGNLGFRPVEHDGRNESSLECPETLEEFEKTILELFSPDQGNGTRLN